ncbi:hypothetical protein ABTH88_20475, partial [Acinetobacter baumannii]
GAASGPSWGNPAWPGSATDDLTAALDPTQMEPAPAKPQGPKAGGAKPATGAAPAAPASRQVDVTQAAADSIRAMMLIRTYRVRGHL